MRKLRLSYTLISLWKRGKYEEVVDTYLHLDKLDNFAIKRGKEFDTMVGEYVDANKTLPPELGSLKLNNPITHHKVIVPFSESIDISAEADIWDDPTIYEIKCGVAWDSTMYANTDQITMYFFAIPNAKDAWIYRYNPQTKKFDTTFIRRSDRKIDTLKKEITDIAPQIYKFFKEQAIL